MDKKGPGRPRFEDEKLTPYGVTLNPKTVEIFKAQLDNGTTVSEAIRGLMVAEIKRKERLKEQEQ